MQELLINDISEARSIRCNIDLQDLLYVELDWLGRGEELVQGHTVIVLLDPDKILEVDLIDEDKSYFFNIDRMNLVIEAIKREGFLTPPIAFKKHTEHFEYPTATIEQFLCLELALRVSRMSLALTWQKIF